MRRGLMQWHPMLDVDQFFDNELLSGGFAPAMDVYQEGDNVIVKASLPDIDPEKVNVSVENDVLTVRTCSKSFRNGRESGLVGVHLKILA